ncbi:MAG: MFS transporter [Candidatus Thorarchaeota archaeon]
MISISSPTENSQNPEENIAKKKTMRISIAEGSFGVFSSILVDNYVIPFSLSINSSPFQVGVLTSFGNFISPIGQLIGACAIERKSRKFTLLSGILGQASIYPFFLIIALLFQIGILQQYLPWILIGFFLLYMLSAGIMNPPWFSVMGDIVPEDYRGRYFAKRNLITNSIGLIGILILSFSLDWFDFQGVLFFGFVLIFILGLITRLISALLFTQHYYPPFNFERMDHVKTSDFFKELPKSNFGKFTLFVSLLIFGQWIAGPFFSIYMLNDLHFDYSIYIIINLSSSFVGLFIFPLLGKISDKYGNVILIKIGGLIIPILPLLWLFFNTPLGIILGPQLLSGIGWTAFNLATANFIFDNIASKKRGKYIALYNLLLGIAITMGGLLGSFIITFIPIDFMNQYHFLFLLSSIVRVFVVIMFWHKIEEVRVKTKPIFNLKNLSIYKWLYDITLRSNHNERKNKEKDKA